MGPHERECVPIFSLTKLLFINKCFKYYSSLNLSLENTWLIVQSNKSSIKNQKSSNEHDLKPIQSNLPYISKTNCPYDQRNTTNEDNNTTIQKNTTSTKFDQISQKVHFSELKFTVHHFVSLFLHRLPKYDYLYYNITLLLYFSCFNENKMKIFKYINLVLFNLHIIILHIRPSST